MDNTQLDFLAWVNQHVNEFKQTSSGRYYLIPAPKLGSVWLDEPMDTVSQRIDELLKTKTLHKTKSPMLYGLSADVLTDFINREAVAKAKLLAVAKPSIEKEVTPKEVKPAEPKEAKVAEPKAKSVEVEATKVKTPEVTKSVEDGAPFSLLTAMGKMPYWQTILWWLGIFGTLIVPYCVAKYGHFVGNIWLEKFNWLLGFMLVLVLPLVEWAYFKQVAQASGKTFDLKPLDNVYSLSVVTVISGFATAVFYQAYVDQVSQYHYVFGITLLVLLFISWIIILSYLVVFHFPKIKEAMH